MAGVPYTFATATTSIPLSQLDANFNTQITIGSSTVGLGNTTTTLAGLSNVSTTALTVTNDASISGLTVGKGGGSGSSNTVVGNGALAASASDGYMTSVGYLSLAANTTGLYATGIGAYALKANTTGTDNTALGTQALDTNTTGSFNTGLGRFALHSNTTASYNTAVGYQAGYSNTTGTRNIFIGYQAGYSGATTSYNCIIGNSSGYNLTSTAYGNTFVGADFANGCGSAITTGTRNTIIGGYSGNAGGLDIRTASNYIVLSDGDGNPRQFIDSNGRFQFDANNASSVIGDFNNNTATSPYGIRMTFGSAAPNNTTSYFQRFGDNAAYRFYVYSNGTVSNSTGTYNTISDAKLKENIVDATPKLDDLMKVKVRNYNLIGDKLKQIGFVAQELEQVFPSLIDNCPDLDADNNDLGTITKNVKSSVIIPILVKAIQELNTKVTALEAKLGA